MLSCQLASVAQANICFSLLNRGVMSYSKTMKKRPEAIVSDRSPGRLEDGHLQMVRDRARLVTEAVKKPIM